MGALDVHPFLIALGNGLRGRGGVDELVDLFVGRDALRIGVGAVAIAVRTGRGVRARLGCRRHGRRLWGGELCYRLRLFSIGSLRR